MGAVAGIVQVRIQADGAEDDELALAAGQLRQQLLQLDVEDVQLVSAGSAPDGSRSAGALAVGELSITILQSPELLTALIGAVSGWLGARTARSVEVTLDGDTVKMTGAGSQERQQVVDAWLVRHG